MGDNKKTYTGSCHCGAVKYSLEHAPLEESEIMNCNCSICDRNGYLLIYPKVDDFKLVSGDEQLKGYRFNKKNVEHKFCGECGTSCFVDGTKYGIMCVNVRTFPDIDIGTLKLKPYDGKNLIPTGDDSGN